LGLTRAGGGHNGESLRGARVGRGVRGLGGGGARGSGVRLGLRLGVSRSGVGVHRGGRGGGGAGGGPRLMGLSPGVGRTGPRLVSRDVLGGLGPALTPALSLVSSNGSGALSGGTDEVLTTSLHDTGKGRAGDKSQKSNGVDHFERWKTFLSAWKDNE
jgi:hypothetical protein